MSKPSDSKQSFFFFFSNIGTKKFWDIFKRIKSENFDQIYQSETLPPVEDLINKAYLVTNLAKTKPFQTFDSLNDPISKEEI